MEVHVYPYGPDIQRHFEEMRAAGKSWSEASDASRSIAVDWPSDIRLPVRGDGLDVGWAAGYVSSVSFVAPEGSSLGWYIVLHLSHDKP